MCCYPPGTEEKWLSEADYTELIHQTTTLNSIGEKLGELSFVNAITDVTGFGFIGHLLEMLKNSNYTAVINKQDVPLINSAKELASQFVFPDNTTRNYNAQIKQVEGLVNLDFIFYCALQSNMID